MEKVVISGSAKLKKDLIFWYNHFIEYGYEVLNYPKPIEDDDYTNTLPKVYSNFYSSIKDADIFFLMNEKKMELMDISELVHLLKSLMQ